MLAHQKYSFISLLRMDSEPVDVSLKKMNDMSMSTIRRRHTEAERNVNRLRNCMPDKFTTLVKMHLSFMLDLDGSKFDEMFTDKSEKTEAPTKRKSSTPFSKKSHKEKTVLFGAPLKQENVATIYQLIEFLGRPENIKTEGLFRKTGNLARQRLLKEWLNTGSDLGLDQGTFSPHDCATVLKNFLGELPEPLLTEKYYNAYLQIAGMGSKAVLEKEKSRARSKQLKTLQLLYLLLPRENALLFECLIDLLHRVTKVSENMMTAHSLGTVFAPHLLCPRKLTGEELHSISSTVTECVSFMVDNAAGIIKIPRELAIDVANFWREMEYSNQYSGSPSDDQENIRSSSANKPKKYGSTQAINTMMCFAERKSSSDSDTNNDTQLALAKLYAHVQSMPNSTKKKKLLKQFNRAGGGLQNQNQLQPVQETRQQPYRSKGKHTRSRTFGEQIKKHFSSLKHRRRGSNDPDQCSAGLTWGITPTINIDENDNNVFLCDYKTPNTRRKIPHQRESPAVHIVDLGSCSSPITPSFTTNTKSRKRFSSGSSEGSLPEKRPTPEKLPSSENEIKYILKNPPERKLCPCTPPEHQGKPVALVSPLNHHSPITQSIVKAPDDMQKAIMTPRSRKPMFLLNSPNLTSRESVL